MGLAHQVKGGVVPLKISESQERIHLAESGINQSELRLSDILPELREFQHFVDALLKFCLFYRFPDSRILFRRYLSLYLLYTCHINTVYGQFYQRCGPRGELPSRS